MHAWARSVDQPVKRYTHMFLQSQPQPVDNLAAAALPLESALALGLQVAFEAQRHPCSNPETIADAVYQHAMKQRTKDDVCIFVLCFHPEGSLLSEKQNGSGSGPGPRLQRLR